MYFFPDILCSGTPLVPYVSDHRDSTVLLLELHTGMKVSQVVPRVPPGSFSPNWVPPVHWTEEKPGGWVMRCTHCYGVIENQYISTCTYCLSGSVWHVTEIVLAINKCKCSKTKSMSWMSKIFIQVQCLWYLVKRVFYWIKCKNNNKKSQY